MRKLLVPIPVAIEAIGVGRTKAYQLIGDGRIKVVKIGRRTLVVVASLEALVAELAETQPIKSDSENQRGEPSLPTGDASASVKASSTAAPKPHGRETD